MNNPSIESISEMYELGDNKFLSINQSNINEDKTALCFSKYEDGKIIISDIKIIDKQADINNYININIKTCPYCCGSGELKAMQSVAITEGLSARGKDTKMKCKHCNGSGLIE